jgi:mannose-1-phosphate guanylyltransferase
LKIILLAGGSGSRARPFTDYVPKAMFPLDGRPIIDYLVRYIAQFSQISEIIIICNFDRFGKQIINYFEGKQSILGKPIIFVEDKKNGTGGSLLKIEKYVRHDECFLVWFADNLCALNIEQMIQRYHQVKNMKSGEKEAISIVVVRKRRREETARVILDDSQIKEFMEKEMVKLEQPEALGIYLFSKRIFQYLHERLNEGFANFNLSYAKNTKNVSISFDLSRDILSKIASTGGLFAYDIGDDIEWIDASSPAHVDRNRDIVEKILSQMQS